MMYQARVDAVKVYYMKKLGQKLVDKLARSIELTYEEYLEGKLKWCSVDVWPELCHHWCSEDFLETRKRGQKSRSGSGDNAQNHGGSRPFGETRQVLGEKFGLEFATIINTYSVMKSGIQNVDENGRIAPMVSRKAQKIVDEYTAKSNAADPENSGQQELDAKVLYDVSGGMRHGRVAIGHGAVKKAKVLSAAKEKTVASPNSAPSRHMAKENQRLRHANRCLHERVDQLGELTNDLILNLYSDLGKEVPASLKSRLAALTTNVSKITTWHLYI
ncbi:unnamed protein product [Urochloa humidicola]